jgi:TrmH RNA methyltransferase
MKRTDKTSERKAIPKATRKAEQKIYGFHAAMAVFSARPKDIIRAYVTEETRKPFGPLLKFCAQNKLAYHIVTDEDLKKVSESDHHEGICLLVKSKKIQSLLEYIENRAPSDSRRLVLWLVGVQNPHNVGAVLRSAAHFGVEAVLITPGGPASARPDNWALSGSALRIAEGGAEHVPIVLASGAVAESCQDLKEAGFAVYGTSGHGKGSRVLTLWRANFDGPCVVALGAEDLGLPDGLLQTADKILQIPGSGLVESLNVSVAAAIIAAAASRPAN